jgi:hypothetical protein
VDWMHLAQDREERWVVVHTVMNLQVPQKVGNSLTSWVTISFSRRTLLHVVLSLVSCLVIYNSWDVHVSTVYPQTPLSLPPFR